MNVGTISTDSSSSDNPDCPEDKVCGNRSEGMVSEDVFSNEYFPYYVAVEVKERGWIDALCKKTMGNLCIVLVFHCIDELRDKRASGAK